MTVHPLLFTFYVLLGGALFNIIYLNFTHDIYIDFRGYNFFYCIALPLCSFSGLVTIAEGIRRIGPTRAAVINGNVKKCAVGKHPKSEKLGSTGQAACCARIHSRYFTGGNPSGLRV